MSAVLSSLVDDRLGPGPVSEDLVRRCAEYTDNSGGIAFREYRRAVEVVFDAAEIAKGSPVIISPLAPRVYHDVITAKGAEAIYADVDRNTGCLSAAVVAELAQRGAAACLADSPAGFVPELDAIADSSVPLIEDISTNLGGNHLGRKCGSYGRFSIISLEERNIITAGGGAVILARTKRDLGLLRKAAENLDETYLLPDLNAALAEIQLRNVENFIARRRDIASVYTRSLAKGRHRTFMQDGESENVFFTFPVIFDGGVNDALKYARGKQIMAERAFTEIDGFWGTPAAESCPNAHALLLRCVFFPLYPLLSREQIEQVARVLSTLP